MKPEESLRPSSSAKFWETAEDHRFALEVLALPLRRNILKLMGIGTKNAEEIATELGLSRPTAEYHLALLEKALLVDRRDEGYGCTPTGLLYMGVGGGMALSLEPQFLDMMIPSSSSLFAGHGR
jgi:DNA-binding transcriptional ArsR family regulator